jgi:GntR family transcriptional regulator
MSDSEFPYRRIVAELRASILDGRLAPGDRLGSEWELAEAFATSRPTVRRAVAVLKAEGLVISCQGKGTFVRPRPPSQLVSYPADMVRGTPLAEPRLVRGGGITVIEDAEGPIRRTLARSVDE